MAGGVRMPLRPGERGAPERPRQRRLDPAVGGGWDGRPPVALRSPRPPSSRP